MFDIWNNNEQLAQMVYKKNNYKILNSLDSGRGYCVIYCSSNDIWSPNEEYAFRYSFIVKDKYEWEHSRFIKAEKEIFLRDIYKSWYVAGINARINSIDELILFLKKEIKNLKLITVGSSAGGYLAVLLGVKLEAEKVICFSPQFELCNRWAMDVNPFLRKFSDDESRARYYNLRELLVNTSVPIFNIVPVKSDIDMYHYNIVKGIKNIYTFAFNSSHHGVVMYKCNLCKFLNMDLKMLQFLYRRYENRIISPFLFSIELSGLIATVRNILFEMYRLLIKRIIQIKKKV